MVYKSRIADLQPQNKQLVVVLRKKKTIENNKKILHVFYRKNETL